MLPVLDSVFPPFGPQAGGTLLRVYGRHFVHWAPKQCHFSTAGTVNFARGLRAAQSSVLVNASDTMHTGMWPFTFRTRGPEAAVDGSTNGFGGEYNAVTEQEAAPWWQVDLGANRTLDEVRVFTRSDDPHYEPAPFWIILSDDKPFEDASLEVALGRAMAAALVTENEALDVSAVTSALSVDEDRILAGPDDHSFTWTGLGGVQARHLRVQLHPTGSSRQLALAEVEALSVGRSSGGVFVDALFHNTSMVTCVTPGLRGETLAGNTPVNVSIAYAAKRDLDRSDPLPFRYHPDVHISRLSLDRVHNDAQLPVLVHGTGFQNTTSTNYDYQRYAGGPGARLMPYGDRTLLKCRFGKRSVFATFVNETAIKCVAPPRRKDITVDVEVTLNGIDYTREHVKFWYYGECKVGARNALCPRAPTPAPRSRRVASSSPSPSSRATTAQTLRMQSALICWSRAPGAPSVPGRATTSPPHARRARSKRRRLRRSAPHAPWATSAPSSAWRRLLSVGWATCVRKRASRGRGTRAPPGTTACGARRRRPPASTSQRRMRTTRTASTSSTRGLRTRRRTLARATATLSSCRAWWKRGTAGWAAMMTRRPRREPCKTSSRSTSRCTRTSAPTASTARRARSPT